MIVRNGGASLSKCLESVANLVDEMVVVDTGSTDDSIDVARAHGARVVSTPWRDDFSAARNAYIDVARGSWILSLDADETLPPTDAAGLRRQLTRHPATVFAFMIRNYFSLKDWQAPLPPSAFGGEIEPGVGWTPTRTVRLFPRSHVLRYQYPVHESLLPAAKAYGLSVRPCAIPIHHTGALQPVTERAHKRSKYRRLGLKKLKQYPQYFLGYHELGQVYFADGDIEKADRMFRLCVRLNPFYRRAYYSLIMTSLRLGRPEQARQRAVRAGRLFPRDQDLRYALGLVELETGHTTEGMTALASLLPVIHRPSDRLSV